MFIANYIQVLLYYTYTMLGWCEFSLCTKASSIAGYMGECGLRGGYAEVINLDPDVKAMYLKSISAKLCPTTLGQVSLYLHS